MIPPWKVILFLFHRGYGGLVAQRASLKTRARQDRAWLTPGEKWQDIQGDSRVTSRARCRDANKQQKRQSASVNSQKIRVLVVFFRL